MSELSLQKKCNAWLRKKGWLYFHDEKGSGRGKRHRSGLPDIIIFRNPVVFIELKSTAGKLKSNQAEYHRQLSTEGFEVYTVSKFEEFLLIMRVVYNEDIS